MDTLSSMAIAVHRYYFTTKITGMRQVSCMVNQAARYVCTTANDRVDAMRAMFTVHFDDCDTGVRRQHAYVSSNSYSR